MNGKFFEVPTKIFDAMSKADQWAANKTFLDRAISRGQSFNLATPFDAIRPGSFLEEEVNTEDLLDESNPNFATPDDFEDMTPINLNNVLSK